MKKPLLVAAALAALAWPGLGAQAFAAPPDDHHFSAEDKAAFTDAKIAALKAGLKLTSAQEKNWPALESALRDAMKAKEARAAQWRDKAKELREKHDVIEGMKMMASGFTAGGADLTKVADAAKPLFDTLDDSQKHRFGVLLHVIFRAHHMHHGHCGMMMRHGGDADQHDGDHDE